MPVGQLRDTRGPCAVSYAHALRFWFRAGLQSPLSGFRLRALLSTALVVLAAADACAKPGDPAKGAGVGAGSAQTEQRGDGAKDKDKAGEEKSAPAAKKKKSADDKADKKPADEKADKKAADEKKNAPRFD